MKKLTFLLLFFAAINFNEAQSFGKPWATDDWGFLIESPATSQSNARQSSRSYWTQRRTSRRISNACDYSRDIHSYAQDVKKVAPAVAKAESEELGRNISQAQQQIEIARQESQQTPETVAALKSIGDHLTAAAKHQEMLHEECCKDSVDGKVCMTCCNQILSELEQAKTEHAALVRSAELKSQTSK